jgi:hypothetical protein
VPKLLNFDVAVEPLGDGYRTRVLASPAGEAQADFVLPFDDRDLTILVLSVIRSVGEVRRKVRRIESPERGLVEAFGSQLFDAVFPGPVRGCLGRSRAVAENRDAGLRIRLRLPAALANIPWEYLYDGDYGGFVGLSTKTALVRYMEMSGPVRPFPIRPPLRILAMISAPSDVSALQGEEEWGKLNAALESLVNQGMVIVDRLEDGTLSALQRPLRLHEYHVLHFIGHGGWDEGAQDGALALEDRDGRKRLVTGRDLGMMIRDYGSLRLVVLNACEGARSAQDDPFGGVAQALVRQGIPAVIAMQFEISDPAALVFSQSFYQAIADGLPVDVAMAAARMAMFADGNDVEWATPVLYLRSPDGRVFTRSRVPEADRLAREQEDTDRKAHDADHGQAVIQLEAQDRTRREAEQEARRQEAERAAAQRQQQIKQLQDQIRDHAAAQDWDAVLAVSSQLAVLDPAAADPDALASTARDQITRRQEAERAAAQRQQQIKQLQDQIRDHAAAQDQAMLPVAVDQPATPDPVTADSAEEEIAETAVNHNLSATADRQQLGRHEETDGDAPPADVDKTQPGRDGNRKAQRRRIRSAGLYTAIVGAIALAAILAVSIVLATSQSGTPRSTSAASHPATTPHPTTAPATTLSPSATANPNAALIARLPAVVRSLGCSDGGYLEQEPGVTCPPNTSGSGIPALGDRSYYYNQYSSLSATRAAFQNTLSQPPPPPGNCLNGSTDDAVGTYSIGTHHGQIWCAPGDGSGVIVWSDESTLIVGQESVTFGSSQSFTEAIQAWEQALQVAPVS